MGKVGLATVLPCRAERAWQEVRTTRLLRYVAAPLIVFEAIEPSAWPVIWPEGRHLVRMRLFGLLPLGSQWIVTSVIEDRAGRHRIRDNGEGTIARRWDHIITITERTDGRCDYRDEVEIEAGLLTPLVLLFARFFYAHRQRRWHRLVANDFDF